MTGERALVLSDLHLGGGPAAGHDSFTSDELFRTLLDGSRTDIAEVRTLVLNGDFVDFVRIDPHRSHHDLGERVGVTEEDSVQKLHKAVAAHPQVFDCISQFLKRGGNVVVIPGNHDVDFFWRRVLEVFTKVIGGTEGFNVRFGAGSPILLNRVHIEHGHLYSFDNGFEHWENPIREAADGLPRLERPWGTYFMDLAFSQFEKAYPFMYDARPHWKVAFIFLRDFINDDSVPLESVTEVARFFIANSAQIFGNRLLGDGQFRGANSDSARTLKMLGVDVGGDRGKALLARLPDIPAAGAVDNSAAAGTVTGLLGRTDERGIHKRRRDLLITGQAQIVVFGHTHEPVDGNLNPPWGAEDPRRWFNTGSWVPTIPIGKGEWPSLDELRQRKPIIDPRALLVELGTPASGSLLTLQ